MIIEWPAHACPWFVIRLQKVGRLENMIGWYHSHPGYGCWLSGIDVGTQATQQMYQEPFLAIVIDPHRTIAAGKVEIGAFRTYPEVSDSITFLYTGRACSVQLACFICMSCDPNYSTHCSRLAANQVAVHGKPWHSDISA